MTQAEQDFFAPFVAARLETRDGELVHVALPPDEFADKPGYPITVSFQGRLFDATFRRYGAAHIFREVLPQRRELTERTCWIYEVH